MVVLGAPTVLAEVAVGAGARVVLAGRMTDGWPDENAPVWGSRPVLCRCWLAFKSK